jgi:glycosyltransferase involved in cell wall biosynthesis
VAAVAVATKAPTSATTTFRSRAQSRFGVNRWRRLPLIISAGYRHIEVLVYRGRKVAVVLPAYNVELHIEEALASLPSWVDAAVVVDDGSSDGSIRCARRAAGPPLSLVIHKENQGVGAAIASGYREAVGLGAELMVVMAGDGQMDPHDLPRLLDPLVDGQADYVKGNRFQHADIWRAMPKARIVGNILLSLMTKISSGYWRVFDSQCGYTAISRPALEAIEYRLYPRYGYPNDILGRLRVVGARLAQVPVRPIYQGQESGITLATVFYPIFFLLLRSWIWRLGQQTGRQLMKGRFAKAPLLVSSSSRANIGSKG